MDSKNFDLIVIGTGSAGAGTAKKCAKEGLNVAIIDYRPFGGTCPLRGCDPKKVLVGAADIIDQNRRMQGKGIKSGNRIDWQDLMKFKRTFTDPIPEATVEDMEELGITSFHGKASFVDKQSLMVNDEQINGNKILIAAGNRPAPIPVDGYDHLITSTEFLELDELPGKIVFVGGGYISFEFAHIAARAGATVHILHQSNQPLKSFDTDMVRVLLEKTEELGISVHLNTEAKSIEKAPTGFITHASKNDQSVAFSSDLVIHGAGRVPEIDALDLDKANIKYSKKGVEVNSYLQSVSNEHIYAAGDAAASKGIPLTPLAGFESNVANANILEGNHQEAEYPAQPTAVFTVPPLASVGLTEEQARKQNEDIEVKFQETGEWYSYRRTNETHTAFKTIINKKNGQLLGAHILGSKAEEVINLFAVAINQNLKPEALKKMIYAYPSHASDLPYMV